ncbi:est [Symbiodinium sp. CCMP2592]|nr:est [Symbiodinium sp. CCMP2592]
MSTYSLQSPPGAPPGPGQGMQPRLTSIVRPAAYYVRAPAPAVQVQVAGAPRPPGGPGVPGAAPLPRPVRWSVAPGTVTSPLAGHPGMPVVRPVPVVPKQPIPAVPAGVQALRPVNATSPVPVPQPGPAAPVHPLQVLGQSLAVAQAPAQAEQEPETSEETRPESEASSATSPRSAPSPAGATASPPTDSPNDVKTPEPTGTPKGQPVPAVEELRSKKVAAESNSDTKPAEEPRDSSCTKSARHRDQPALAVLAAAFAAGTADDVHLQRGFAADVRKLELPEAGLYPDIEDMGSAEWPTWVDSTAEDTGRGGAIAFVPSSVRSDSHCIYFVHGGGFEYGSPLEDGYDSLCSRIAAGSGLVVVCPDHPLSGESRPFKAPEIIDVLLKGLRWLLRFDPVTKERRKAPPKLIVAGDSAGATQALSIALRALEQDDTELTASLCGLVLISPWLDLSCGSHTYVSNAYAEEGDTGDLAFREHADDNRASFRRMAMTYTGSSGLLKDATFSPYWLVRNLESDLVAKLAKLPMWICAGAAETLSGEVLDFAQRLRGKVPIEAWLHEGMFHDWVMYTTDHPMPSKDAAMNNMFDFIARIRGTSFNTANGIHYYIDEWE